VLNLFYNKKQTLMGVEFHSSRINIVVLTRCQSQWLLEHTTVILFSEESGKGVKQLNAISVGNSIRGALPEQYHNLKVVIGLSSQDVLAKQVKLAEPLTKNECEAELTANIDYYLPGVGPDVTVDFFLANSQDLFLVAAPQQQIKSYVDIVKQAGFAVQCVEYNLYSLIRAACFAYPKETTLAIFDCNSESAQLVLFQKPYYIIHYPLHKHDLTHQLMHIAQLCRNVHANFVFPFVILSGSKSLLGPIKPLLEQVFQKTAVFADPFANMQCASFSENSTELLASCGLALRGN